MEINDLRLFGHSAFGLVRAGVQSSRTAKTRSALPQITCAIALHAITIPHVNGNAITNIQTIFRARTRIDLRGTTVSLTAAGRSPEGLVMSLFRGANALTRILLESSFSSKLRHYLRNGLVAFFDILGYRELIKQNQIVSVAVIIDEIFLATSRKSKEARGFVTSLINEKACEHFVFSDSILVFLPLEGTPDGNTRTAQSLFASHCAGLVTEFFWKGLPVRGALAYGDCYFKSEDRVVCFAGNAIVEAYDLANSLDFAACVVASSKDAIFTKISPNFFEYRVCFSEKTKKRPKTWSC